MRCVTTTRRPLAVMPVTGNEAGNLRRHTASKNNYSRPCRKKQSRFGTLKGPLQLFHRFFWPKSGVKLKPSHDQRHQLSSVHRDKDLVVVHPLTHSGSRGLPGVQCDPVTPPMESRRDPPPFAMTGEGSADTVRGFQTTAHAARRARPVVPTRIFPSSICGALPNQPVLTSLPKVHVTQVRETDPFQKPLPTTDELPFWAMRDVLPELMMTSETAVGSRP